MSSPQYQYQRISTSPVLAKGGTYDGWVADAMADPSITFNPVLNVFGMVVSLWDNTRGKWASAFFTSPLAAIDTWSYVSGSLQAPTGTDTLLGNGGLIFANTGTYSGLYIHAYNLFPLVGVHTIYLATSPDLVTWTIRSSAIIAFGTPDDTQNDPDIDFNPNTNRFEVSYVGGDDIVNGRPAMFCDSSNGSAYTRRGTLYTPGTWNTPGLFGEPRMYYRGAARVMTTDVGGSVGYRLIAEFVDPAAGTTFTQNGSVVSPNVSNAWEANEVFDSSPILFDLGDGAGTVEHMFYAGGDNNSATDNTDSSIGRAVRTLQTPITVAAVLASSDALTGTYNLTGTGTSWGANTVFQILSGSGAVVSSQTVTNLTTAQVVVTFNGNRGPFTVLDNQNRFTMDAAPTPSTGNPAIVHVPRPGAYGSGGSIITVG